MKKIITLVMVILIVFTIMILAGWEGTQLPPCITPCGL